jgi:hypothetical protein
LETNAACPRWITVDYLTVIREAHFFVPPGDFWENSTAALGTLISFLSNFEQIVPPRTLISLHRANFGKIVPLGMLVSLHRAILSK